MIVRQGVSAGDSDWTSGARGVLSLEGLSLHRGYPFIDQMAQPEACQSVLSCLWERSVRYREEGPECVGVPPPPPGRSVVFSLYPQVPRGGWACTGLPAPPGLGPPSLPASLCL